MQINLDFLALIVEFFVNNCLKDIYQRLKNRKITSILNTLIILHFSTTIVKKSKQKPHICQFLTFF